jgi:hypothetical protein
MSLGLIVSPVFTYPIIEMIEEWRLRRSAKKDLRAMRKHVSAGDQWDITRGRWI